MREQALASHGLIGVSNLSSLRILNLSYNRFSGEIPASLGHLGRLQVLDLTPEPQCFLHKDEDDLSNGYSRFFSSVN